MNGKMWSNLISLIVGFAAGCSFKELLDKGLVQKVLHRVSEKNMSGESNEQQIFQEFANTTETQQSEGNLFSLHSVAHVFKNNGVSIKSASSFNILLREVRNNCYKNILKNLIEKASSPELLVEFLKSESTPSFNIEFEKCFQSPFIEEFRLNDLIKKEGANPNEVGTIDDKVKFLLGLSHARGIEDFKRTLGFYFSEILQDSESGKDINDLYNQIMRLVKSRYEMFK